MEKFLISLYPLCFLLILVAGHLEGSFKMDRFLKIKELSSKTVKLGKSKILFAFYERKKGLITKETFVFSIYGYISEIIYIISIALFVWQENKTTFLILAGVWIVDIIFFSIYSTYFDHKYGFVPKRRI